MPSGEQERVNAQVHAQTLLIRADASPTIGTGHIMRCLALAQAWKDRRGRAVFAVSSISSALEDRLHSEGFESVRILAEKGSVEDAKETSQLALKWDASWIVVDGYYFGSEYQRIARESGMHLLILDDYGHADHYYADLVLNQNLQAHEDLYIKREPYTGLLLGTRYVLIRREFFKWVGRDLVIPEIACKVLVTMGGSDPENMTMKVIQALNYVEIQGLKALIMVGGSNLHYEKLKSEINRSKRDIRLIKNVQDMSDLIAWSDIAIASGGSGIWELALMGIPVIGLARAKQEYLLLENAARCGISINLGFFETIDVNTISEKFTSLALNKDLRSEMSKIGRFMIDGLGSARVLDSMGKV